MLIYLDMCSLQRPLDDRSQLRVRLEAEAVLGIIAYCEAGGATLVSSDALEFENSRNPHPVRKAHASSILDGAALTIRLCDEIERRARDLTQVGIKPLDTLHLASALEANSHYFCTCDDRFSRRAKATQTGATRVVSPLELAEELGL